MPTRVRTTHHDDEAVVVHLAGDCVLLELELDRDAAHTIRLTPAEARRVARALLDSAAELEKSAPCEWCLRPMDNHEPARYVNCGAVLAHGQCPVRPDGIRCTLHANHGGPHRTDGLANPPGGAMKPTGWRRPPVRTDANEIAAELVRAPPRSWAELIGRFDVDELVTLARAFLDEVHISGCDECGRYVATCGDCQRLHPELEASNGS